MSLVTKVSTKIGPGYLIRNTKFIYFAQLTNNLMNYSNTLDFLFSSLPMYQRIGKAAYKSDLKTTIRLDNYFGNPHRSFKTVHIAGTNGKGSVSHMLASVMQAAGYKTGLYTSPHFTDFRERIRVNGIPIDKKYIIDFVESNRDIIKELEPSFFEMTVALAFLYFQKKNVDIAVIETGMGGRLDSTNVITPELSVITNISFDHTQYLGDTLGKIATEKAGIIKHRVPVVIGRANKEVREVFITKAREMNSDIYFAEDLYSLEKSGKDSDGNKQVFNVYMDDHIVIEKLSTDLLGDYQSYNIITVLQVVHLLQKNWKINSESLRNGLDNVKGNTGFTGRWQIMQKSPLVICDAGHNYDGLLLSVSQLKKMGGNKIHIVLGVVNDKDIDSMLGVLPGSAKYYFTRAGIPRAMDEKILEGKASFYNLKGHSYRTVREAYDAAMANAGSDDIIFISGSSFVVADFLEYFSSE